MEQCPAVGEFTSIAIVTDGSADVPVVERDVATGPDVRWMVLPDRWHVSGAVLLDDGEQARELTRMALGDGRLALPEASAADAFAAVYDSVSPDTLVLSIHARESVSPAIVAARASGKGRPNVEVVEVSAAGIGVGLVAVRAAALARDGASPDVVLAYVRRHASGIHLLVVPDHFDPMAGRRVVAARLLAGRPMLGMDDSGLSRRGRLRSRRQAVAAIQRTLEQHAPADRTLRIAIGHADAAGALDPLLDIIDRMRPNAAVELVGRIGPRVVRAVGGRCVGLAWLAE